MVNNRYGRGIIFSVLMLSAVLVGITTLTAVAFAGPVSTIEVNVNNPSPLVNQTISITATARDVNGTISTDLNGTMQFFANGISLASAPIISGVASTTFTTAMAGTVTIIAEFNAIQGTTTVVFSAPALSLSANPTTVTVGTATNVAFTVSPAISGATVTLIGAATGSGTTDASGSVTISVNATGAGTITATASMTGYTDGIATLTAGLPPLNVSTSITSVAVGNATNVIFTVSPAISGATITLTGAATGSGTTDASGSVTISVNATGAGTITATASMTGYTEGTATLTAGLPPLTVSANPTNVTVGILTNVIFTVSPAVSGATVTLTGAATGSETTDANGSATISVNSTGAGTITVTPSMTGYTGVSIDLIAQIATDTTPPESITNLTMENNGTSWIKWSWTNPIGDFSYVAVWITNGWHNASVGANSFNTSVISPLLSGTEYTIATHTVDTTGNVNSTWVNLTSSTLPNTPVSSSPITVTLPLNSSVTFTSVSVAVKNFVR